MRIVHLEITSWVGTCAIGAQHYYGTIVHSSIHGFHGIKTEIELRRLLTAKERREYNAEMIAQGCASLKATKDQTTRGFANEDEVITYGIKTAKEQWPDANFLLINGDHDTSSARPIIYAPPGFEAEATQANVLAEQWEKIERATRWKPGYPPELDAIDNEYKAIIEKAKTYEQPKEAEKTCSRIPGRRRTKVPPKDKAHI